MWVAVCLFPSGDSSAQAAIARINGVPERALQLAVEVGRGCSGCASGVLGAVDCCLSSTIIHSSAQAVIAQTLRHVPERALPIAADVGRRRSVRASGSLEAVNRWLAPQLSASAQVLERRSKLWT